MGTQVTKAAQRTVQKRETSLQHFSTMAKSLLILLGLALVAANHVVMAAKGAKEKAPKKDAPKKEEAKKNETEEPTVGIGLIFRPTECDTKSKSGDLVRVTFNVSTGYKGPLGQGFEKRYEEEPLEFILGSHQMIPGFEVGLTDMCVGEIRHISVPEEYAYGGNNLGAIPARTTMYFFVKMISFEAVPHKDMTPENVFKSIDTNNDDGLSHDEVKEYLLGQGHKDVAGDSGLKQMVREIFQEEDRDNNGYIMFKEFSGPKHDYASFY